MKTRVFTFWEGRMPSYLRMCLDTWQCPFTILTFDTVSKYTNSLPKQLFQLSLPKIADYIRVHVLRDNGGYWMDVDTIMLNNLLPTATILGDPTTRISTIGFLHTEPMAPMFVLWAKYQDLILNHRSSDILKICAKWNVMGNAFIDRYLKHDKNVIIGAIQKYWPELSCGVNNSTHYLSYNTFYFENSYSVKPIYDNFDMLMLHNSWTPAYYKNASREEVLNMDCTLSNILRSYGTR